MVELQSLRTDDFDYQLPPKFIAQIPAESRDLASMMVLHRGAIEVAHRRFNDIESYLNPGDALVLNDTRVLPARLRGKKESGGKVELLLLRRVAQRTWAVMVGGSGMGVDARVEISDGNVSAMVLEDLGGPRRLVRFSRAITPMLGEIGEIPLPPYIATELRDGERYQTVYAANAGSAAAPTAGLHFTADLLADIVSKGVKIVMVTLHVGMDTFASVKAEMVSDHRIQQEWFCLEENAAETINSVRDGGGRVIAVGTTTVRVLETAARGGSCGEVTPMSGETGVFITPGYRFRAVDALVTNFHLPRSTPLMMVAAFLGAKGRMKILQAYQIAMQARYRFYSFGDAMLIL